MGSTASRHAESGTVPHRKHGSHKMLDWQANIENQLPLKTDNGMKIVAIRFMCLRTLERIHNIYARIFSISQFKFRSSIRTFIPNHLVFVRDF